MKRYLDNIAQWSVIISACFLVFGLMRAWLYFLAFNISVLTYIDLGEIFTIWFPDTVITLIVTLVAGTFVFAIYDLKPQHKEYYQYFNVVVYFVHFCALVFIVGDLMFNWFGRNSSVKADFNRNSPYLPLMSLIGIFGFFSFISGVIKLVYTFKKQKSNDTIIISRGIGIINASFITAYVFVFMIYEPIGTIRENPEAFTIIELKGENQNFTSDSTNRYVGKTRNYIFISNIETGTSTVLPVSEFYEIKMIDNPRTTKK